MQEMEQTPAGCCKEEGQDQQRRSPEKIVARVVFYSYCLFRFAWGVQIAVHTLVGGIAGAAIISSLHNNNIIFAASTSFVVAALSFLSVFSTNLMNTVRLLWLRRRDPTNMPPLYSPAMVTTPASAGVSPSRSSLSWADWAFWGAKTGPRHPSQDTYLHLRLFLSHLSSSLAISVEAQQDTNASILIFSSISIARIFAFIWHHSNKYQSCWDCEV